MAGVPFTDGSGRSLGSELRACRQGYRWANPLQRYLRISPTSDEDLHQIEFATPDRIRTEQQRRGPRPNPEPHRAWWEGDDEGRAVIFDGLAPLVTDTPYQLVIIDDAGTPQ